MFFGLYLCVSLSLNVNIIQYISRISVSENSNCILDTTHAHLPSAKYSRYFSNALACMDITTRRERVGGWDKRIRLDQQRQDLSDYRERKRPVIKTFRAQSLRYVISRVESILTVQCMLAELSSRPWSLYTHNNNVTRLSLYVSFSAQIVLFQFHASPCVGEYISEFIR